MTPRIPSYTDELFAELGRVNEKKKWYAGHHEWQTDFRISLKKQRRVMARWWIHPNRRREVILYLHEMMRYHDMTTFDKIVNEIIRHNLFEYICMERFGEGIRIRNRCHPYPCACEEVADKLLNSFLR